MAQTVSETNAQKGVREPDNSSMNQIRYGQEQKYGADRRRVGNTLGNVRYVDPDAYAPGTMNQTRYK